MDFKKGRGGGKGDEGSARRPAPARRPGLGQPGDTIDASPGADAPLRGRTAGGPRSIQDTKAWQESSSGVKRAWSNYKNMLGTQFQRMPRADQETFITRICQIVTIGSAVLVAQFFYHFVPEILRVFLLPAMIVGAYFAGTKVVAPMMILRFERYLNTEY